MPFQLPPLTRRQFIAGSATTGAACLFSPRLFAANKPVDENLWVFFSDTHIAADRAVTHLDANMAVNLEKVTREVLELPRRPAGLILSGDCALVTGEIGDYSTMTALLKPLRETELPIHITVGNHDNRDRFWSALAGAGEAARPLEDRQAAIVKTPRANWFILDTLDQTNVTPGRLGAKQLEWLAKTLDANTDKPALIVAHHHLKTVGDPVQALQETDELLAVIRPRKQVKGYFYGHTHDWGLHRDESGIHLINLPPTAFLFAAGRPNGWVRADLKPDGIRLELRCLDPKHQEHGRVAELEYRG